MYKSFWLLPAQGDTGKLTQDRFTSDILFQDLDHYYLLHFFMYLFSQVSISYTSAAIKYIIETMANYVDYDYGR